MAQFRGALVGTQVIEPWYPESPLYDGRGAGP